MEYLKMIEEMDNKFEFDYKDGKGRFSVNINSFFETVGSRDFKQFLDIVDLSSNPFSVAEKVQEIVFSRYQHEKNFAGSLSYNEKLVNKLSGFLESLEKRYGFSIPEEEKQPEKIKFKKCIVFTFGTNNHGEREVNCYDGFKFQKFGLWFSVYKMPKCRKNWVLTVPFCGMSLNSYGSTTKEAAAAQISEKTIACIFEQLKKPDFMEMVNLFQNLAKESNFAHLFDTELCAVPSLPVEESTEKEETATPEKPVEESAKEESATMHGKVDHVTREDSKTASRRRYIVRGLYRKDNDFHGVVCYNDFRYNSNIILSHTSPNKGFSDTSPYKCTLTNKSPVNRANKAILTAINTPCESLNLLDFAKNGNQGVKIPVQNQNKVFAVFRERFAVSFVNGKSPPGGYQKFLQYFENKNGGIRYE